MNTEDWLSLVIIALCLALSFFFSGSETALTAFSRARMLRMEKTGNRRASLVNRLLETRERMIGAILTGSIALAGPLGCADSDSPEVGVDDAEIIGGFPANHAR